VTLVVSVFLFNLYENLNVSFIKKVAFLIFVISLASLSTFSSLYVLRYPQRGTYPIENLRQTVHYLNNNFKNEEEIFTGAAIIPYLSGKNLALNITHPTIYCNCVPIEDEIIYTLFPTEEEIMNYFDTNTTRLILVEKLTRGAYFTRRPALSNYLKDNYELRKTIGEENPIEVYMRKI